MRGRGGKKKLFHLLLSFLKYLKNLSFQLKQTVCACCMCRYLWKFTRTTWQGNSLTLNPKIKNYLEGLKKTFLLELSTKTFQDISAVSHPCFPKAFRSYTYAIFHWSSATPFTGLLWISYADCSMLRQLPLLLIQTLLPGGNKVTFPCMCFLHSSNHNNS